MIDNNKVINGLKYCTHTDGAECPNCPYWQDDDCVETLNADVLALLKEQEEIRHGEWKWSHGGECSECGYHNSNFNYKYCQMCGAMMDA